MFLLHIISPFFSGSVTAELWFSTKLQYEVTVLRQNNVMHGTKRSKNILFQMIWGSATLDGM